MEEKIPSIYNYSPINNEFLYSREADKDPAESELQGKFIPLVPAYATLIEPPEVEENQVQVFSDGEWIVEVDYRKNFYKVNENLEVFDITTIGEQTGFIVVSKEVGEQIKENKDYYKIVDNNIVRKSDEEYEKEQEEKEKARIARLSLTKREVFLALYRAKGLTPEMVRSQITDTEALIEFDYATDYYRFNPLIDSIGAQLGYTPADLDYLFIHKEFPSAEE